MTLGDRVKQAREELARAGITAGTARLDAELLARHVLGWDRATWLSRNTDAAESDFVDRYDRLLSRRLAREPMAYIRGVQEFWGREFQVTTAVLIPRPETELLIEVSLEYLADRAGPRVADVGTGSGCVAVTLALEVPAAEVFATDISAGALQVAAANAERLGVAARVRFFQGTYLAGTPVPLDLIVSNPPYVRATDRPVLPPEVRDHEPSVALFGGDDGLRDVTALLLAARTALADDGRLIMEIGDAQAEDVEALIAASGGLTLDEIRPDLQGIPRTVVARRVSG
jgi:release factor glutamine methyltransferase